jgi:hypothetical protein
MMRRVEGDRMLSTALMQKMRLGIPGEVEAEVLDADGTAPDAGESAQIPVPMHSVDPGLTGQIQLDLGEEE